MTKTNSILIRFLNSKQNIRNIYYLSAKQTKLNTKYNSNDLVLNSKPFNSYLTQKRENSNDFRYKRFDNKFLLKSGALLATIGTTLGFYLLYDTKQWNGNRIDAKEPNEAQVGPREAQELEEFGREMDGLKSISAAEVAEHNDVSKRVWVSFRSGVYDITDFVGLHPGGRTILMASGGALEPFWTLFAVHKTREVMTLLEKYRIGNLAKEDRTAQTGGTADANDPFANEPRRHPALRPRSVKPFNAEPPEELLVQSYLTPNELFFVRNHLPVPEIDVNNYTLEIEGFGLKTPKTLSLEEIKTKFAKQTITSSIHCAGNRRNEMNGVKEVKGLSWGSAAISNAEWSGARLTDVLEYFGLDFKDQNIKYVQFEGLDFDVSSNPYGASVEALKALNPNTDFLLAYQMNGEDIPLDHGFPLRLIAPGIVGARNVKWLARIVLSDEESHSHWQRKDYKSFSPNTDWDNVDFESAPSIQEMPVQSAICQPKEGWSVRISDKRTVKAKGYAWSGGGRKVIRVDVSADGGLNWTTAQLEQEDSHLNRTYSWTLWEADIPVPKECKSGQKIELICKATDSHYNSQPESVQNIWNLRGVLNNSWHRITVGLK